MELHYISKVLSTIPDADTEVLPGVVWGDYCKLFTPAFWKVNYELYYSKISRTENHKIGESILEEVAACLLGGYGIPSEMGLMAFERLKSLGLIIPFIDLERIQNALCSPFDLGNGKSVKYRFHKQKSKYLHQFLNREDLHNIPSADDLQLREWLLSIDGIGPKTASWITRNWLNSDNVAILDIHIIRAGILAGFFDSKADVSSQYTSLEKRYLNFCQAIDASPSNLDAFIWYYMKRSNKLAIEVLSLTN